MFENLDIKIWGVPGDPPYRHLKKLIGGSLFFGCLMTRPKRWDGFWLDDFLGSGTFFWGSHLFAHKSPLEAIFAWFEGIKTWLEPPEFTPTNSGVERPYRMPVHARFTC